MRARHIARVAGALCLWVAALSCATAPTLRVESSIDATHRWSRVQQSRATRPADAGVAFYRAALSRTLGSRCTWYPSDSELAQWRFRRCDPVPTIYASMARWLAEPDAAYVGMPVAVIRGEALFIEERVSCWER